MNRRLVLATLAAVTGATVLAGVAAAQAGKPRALRRATIEVYFGSDGACHTRTTPYFSVSKKGDQRVTWDIRDETGGCTTTDDVEIRFDKKSGDPVAKCNKRGKKQIQCDLAGATEGRHAYSVWLGKQREDPELDIAP